MEIFVLLLVILAMVCGALLLAGVSARISLAGLGILALGVVQLIMIL